MAKARDPHGPPADAAPSPAEDARPYGYGHRAHQPDPDAHYVFEPGPPRTLPPAQPAPPADTDLVIWKRPMR